MIELKEIKVRYAGNKCNKCDRDMKVGWSAFFDATTKSLYCQPCGKAMQQGEAIESGKNEDAVSPEQFDILLNMFGTQGDVLGTLNQQVNDLIKKVDTLIESLSNLFADRFSLKQSLPEAEKKTKASAKKKTGK